MRAVEAEAARLDRRQAGAAMGTVEMDAEELLVPALGRLGQRHDSPVRELERQVEALRQPGPDPFPDRDPVDDGLDRVRLRLRQLGRLIGDLDQLAVHPRADQAGPADGLKDIEVLSLAVSHQRGQDLNLLPILQPHQLGDHLLGRLAEDRHAARGTMRLADPGEQQSQIVVDLGDRPQRAPRIGRPGPLVDRHGRRQALDRVDVGPLELVEELPGIARKAFEIPALAFGIDRVKRQRALPRPADARQDDQAIPRQVDVDILQVVHAGTADLDRERGRRARLCLGRRRGLLLSARSCHGIESVGGWFPLELSQKVSRATRHFSTHPTRSPRPRSWCPAPARPAG